MIAGYLKYLFGGAVYITVHVTITIGNLEWIELWAKARVASLQSVADVLKTV